MSNIDYQKKIERLDKGKVSNTFVRSYEINHCANQLKQYNTYEFITHEWRSALTWIKQKYIALIRNGMSDLRLLTKEELDFPETLPINGRVLKNAMNQVLQDLKSWQELAVISGRRIIHDYIEENNLTDQQAHTLFKMNKSRQWFQFPWNYFSERILKTTPFPVYDKTMSMIVDDYTLTGGGIKHSRDDVLHDLWMTVKLGTLMELDIPIERSVYFEQQMSRGNENKRTTISFKNGRMQLWRSVVIEKDDAEDNSLDGIIAADWGLTTMFSTSDNRLLGVRMIEKLKDWDQELLRLERDLKKYNVKLKKSKRYRKFQSRIREYVKNEIGRILNILIQEGHSVYAFESLDFRHGGLSRQMNRILNRAGRGVVKKKLRSMTEEYDCEVFEVNPAYTSQECSSCGFVFWENRYGSNFHCLACGLRLHADVNAARNILRRSQDGLVLAYKSKEQVLTILDECYYARWGVYAHVLRDLYLAKETGVRVSG